MPKKGTQNNVDGIMSNAYVSVQEFLAANNSFPSWMCPPSRNRTDLPPIVLPVIRTKVTGETFILSPKPIGFARRRGKNSEV